MYYDVICDALAVAIVLVFLNLTSIMTYSPSSSVQLLY